MKRVVMLMVLGALTAWMPVAMGASRTVLMEHFSEDNCLFCPEVAGSIESFLNHHTLDQAVVISYLARGAEAVPGGLDRLDFFGKDVCPQVFVDGVIDLEDQMPVQESDLTGAYNSRAGVSSPITMEVFKENDTTYRIHIEAESGVSGVLMAVAYEDIYHDGTHYPKFARQLLTDYWGETISLSAGETRDITKTVSLQGGWNPANMGVVAWVHAGAKGGKGFRPHEVYQAADSLASHSSPTATPTPYDTPTPPPGTPTPTPTFSETEFQQRLELSQTMYYPGDRFLLNIYSRNPGTTAVTVDQYLALQVLDLFYFWPSWSQEIDKAERTYGPGYDGRETIFDFTWPSGVGSFDGIWFWLVALDPDTFELVCPYDSKQWGYAE